MSNGDLTESGQELGLLAGDDLVEIARRAEQRVEAVKKIKELALRVTNQHDWQDEGGKPYLWVSGAEKVARLFGISWRISEPETEEHEDGHITYFYKGYFSMAGKEIEAVGSRSSRDDFFAKAKGALRDTADIKMHNVRKAAYTNCLGNGITRLLGIRNLTWDELAAAGITKGRSNAVDRSGVPLAPKFGEFAGQPLSEVDDKWLSIYGDTVAESLDIGEKVLIEKDDAAAVKKEKQAWNAAIDKKIKFKASNQKMLDAIMAEVDARKQGAAQSPEEAGTTHE